MGAEVLIHLFIHFAFISESLLCKECALAMQMP
jgi:hypothetical protein